MAYESRLAIQSVEEARKVANLLKYKRITGEGAERAIADLRAFDKQQRNLANIRRDEAGYDPTAGMSGGQKFVAGIGSGLTDVGVGAQQLVGMKSREDVARKRETDAPLLRTGAGMAGNIAGQIAATAPAGALGVAGRGATALRLARGGAMQGGVTGAVLPVAGDESRLKNAAVGAGLGAAIPIGLRGAGRALAQSPGLDDMARAMRRLQDQGVALTRADTLRSPAAQQVARLGRDSLSGQVARRGGDARRNASIARAVLRHIGEDADTATPEVLTRARLRIGREFEDVFSPDAPVRMTEDLIRTRADILKNLPLSGDSKAAVLAELKRVRESFKGGRTTGRTVKELTAHLRRRAESARKGQALDAADAFDDLTEGLEEAAFSAAGPEAQKRIAVARRQWRNLRAVERAADRDWGGGIAPRKLASYLSRNKYTRNAYGRAEKGSLEELARDLDSIADKLPDSGTPRGIISAGEQGAALAAPFSGGASLLPSALNAITQRGLASRAPQIGKPSVLRNALGRVAEHPATAPTMNAAALMTFLRQAANDDPDLLAKHLPPEVVESLRQSPGRPAPAQAHPQQSAPQNPDDVSTEDLEALLGIRHAGADRPSGSPSGVERVEAGPDLMRALAQNDYERNRKAKGASGTDLRASLSGAWDAVESKGERETLLRQFAGNVRKALKDRRISRAEAETLLAQHGLSLDET